MKDPSGFREMIADNPNEETDEMRSYSLQQMKSKSNINNRMLISIQTGANIVDKTATVLSAGADAASKINSLLYKGRYFDNYPLSGLAKYSSKIGLVGTIASSLPIIFNNTSTREKLIRLSVHAGVGVIGYSFGGYLTAFLGAAYFQLDLHLWRLH